MLQNVLTAFGLPESIDRIVPFGSGLINHTWKISHGSNNYILQRINDKVFKTPDAIAYNISITGHYLQQQYPGYLFVLPVKSIYNEDIFFEAGNGYYRLMPFVENSHTADVVQQPALAFEAAKQFGKFTRLLSGFDAGRLKITLPDFHNLSLRYRQFEESLVTGNAARIKASEKLIADVVAHKSIADVFDNIKWNAKFKQRVTHHDTKISNVLFDENDKGLCVIDLDTLMPGYFISDAGDMLRTYLSPVSEEEKDFSAIEIRDDYFKAVAKGYTGELKGELSKEEISHFVYAGKFMIYMQAIRFLTDHINNDVYYGATYEGHNFVRAGNQLTLLRKLIDREHHLQKIMDDLSAGLGGDSE